MMKQDMDPLLVQGTRRLGKPLMTQTPLRVTAMLAIEYQQADRRPPVRFGSRTVFVPLLSSLNIASDFKTTKGTYGE